MSIFKVKSIDVLEANLERLQKNDAHYLSFCVHYELKGVADTLTGIVYKKSSDSDFVCSHFNDPKGNSRKVIALKNKLKAGVFDGLKKILFDMSIDTATQLKYSLPLEDEDLILMSKS